MLRLLLVLLGTGLLWSPSVAENQQSASRKAAKDSSTNKQVVPPSSTAINPSAPIKQGETEPSASQKNAPEKPLPRFERPEWVIVYVTTIYVCISAWTLVAIKRQADVMERQADISEQTARQTGEGIRLARKQIRLARIGVKLTNRQLDISAEAAAAATHSAHALMSGDRAWITVSVRTDRPPRESYTKKLKTIQDLGALFSLSEGWGEQPSFDIIYVAKNSGKTPAWITAIGAKAQVVLSLQELPMEPDYSAVVEDAQSKVMLVPNESIEKGNR
jgi:hypothetical protein